MARESCKIHKELRTPQYRQRVVEDKKKKAKAKAYWADVDFYLVKYRYQMDNGYWSTSELEVMVKGFPNKDGHDEAERLAREMVGSTPMEIVSITYI